MKQLIVRYFCYCFLLLFCLGVGHALARVAPDSRIRADLRTIFDQSPIINGFPYQKIVETAGARYDIPVPFILAVVRGESFFDPRAISAKGAIGLMQVMPSTAADYGLKPDDLLDPDKNIDVGTHYLLDLYTQMQDPYLTLAAYYCGSGGVDRENYTLRQDCDDYVHYIHTHLKKILAGGEDGAVDTVGHLQQFSLTQFDNLLDAESFMRLLSRKDIGFQLDIFRQEVVHLDHRRMQYQILVAFGQNIEKETICSEIEKATGFSFCK